MGLCFGKAPSFARGMATRRSGHLPPLRSSEWGGGVVEKARALFVRNGFHAGVPRRPVDQALRERSRILSDLRSGSKHLVFRIRAFASRQHSAYGGLGGNDVQGDEVSKPRTPVVTVTGGARGRYEEGNLKDDASSSLAHRRKVLRSAPSAHVAIVPRPFYACKSVETGMQTVAPFARVRPSSRAHKAPKPRTAPVDGARRVARRADGRMSDGMAPRGA